MLEEPKGPAAVEQSTHTSTGSVALMYRVE